MCSLFVDGRYVGSGAGAGELDGRVFECYGGGVVLRLVEDGYVNYEDGEVEVGLLRGCGEAGREADEVRRFEDGAVYIYRDSVCGNGVFVGEMPVVYSDVNQVFATATFGSILLTLAAVIGETPRSYVQL
jgi:hypothetical protein